MPQAKGLKEVSYVDIIGGGQVTIQGNYCYIAHMDAPAGTSILDISDPKHPKQVAHIAIPPGVHTHKVRVENDLMVVNWECPPPYVHDDSFQGGLLVYDVSNPAKPKELCFWKSAGAGGSPPAHAKLRSATAFRNHTSLVAMCTARSHAVREFSAGR